MQTVSYIQKEKKSGMNYTIVSHDAVTAKVRPALVDNGIVYYPINISRQQSGNRTEVDLVLRFANIDNPQDYIDVAGIGYGIDNQDKGPGKAVSYAVKYCLLKALGLETGDDPDHESVEHGPDPHAEQRQPRKPAGMSDDPDKVLAHYKSRLVSCENMTSLRALYGTAYKALQGFDSPDHLTALEAAKDEVKAKLEAAA